MIVDFVDHKGRGFGHVHSEFFSKEYRRSVREIEPKSLPYLIVRDTVLIIKYKRSRNKSRNLEQLRESFSRLRELCLEEGITSVSLDIDFVDVLRVNKRVVRTMIESIFWDTGINIDFLEQE